jgi:Sap, sulfolipid-1-addressing protein
MWTIMVLLLLRGEHGVIKAAAFAGGAMTTRLLAGMLFGYIFRKAEDAGGEAGPNLIGSTLQVMVGVFLLIAAVTAWRKGDDPDAPSPKWMTTVTGVSTHVAFALGLGLMAIALKQWLFTFSAIAAIEQAHVGLAGSVLAYLFFIVGAQLLMLAPIIGTALAPTRSAKTVGVMQGWLERHNSKIAMAASLVFGVWFLWKGATDLLAQGGVTAPIKALAN